jgi:hypothetical protein
MFKRIALSIVVALGLVIPIHAQTLYGISNGFGTPEDNLIYQINPLTGSISNSFQVTLPGFTVQRSLAMAAQPGTGTLFALLQTDADSTQNRRLVTIDPTTGVATTIGQTGNAFATLAFRANGTLYGVTGDGASSNRETLFTLSVTNATPTLQFALGNGNDGETIAFHSNGLMYHSSGNTVALFESVNVDTQEVIPIGQTSPEMFAMGFNPTSGVLFGSDILNNLFTIDITTGARTFIGNINAPNDNRGLAFVAAVPEPGTFALIGISVAGVGAFHLRRMRKLKKATLYKAR